MDFRKGANGLAAMIKDEMRADPFSGVIYVFRAKRADRIKLLYWDGTGIVLVAKTLEQGGFRCRRPTWPENSAYGLPDRACIESLRRATCCPHYLLLPGSIAAAAIEACEATLQAGLLAYSQSVTDCSFLIGCLAPAEAAWPAFLTFEL